MRFISPARAVTLALAGFLLAVQPASATTLRRMDLAELVSRADRVVHARAVGHRVYWDESGTQIHTDTTFEVVEDAKGRGSKNLTVTMHGGRIDPVEISSPGTPTFVKGEEVVLFTSSRPDGKKNLVGFSQGHMKIEEDESGHKTALSAVPAGVTFVESREGRPEITHPRSARVPLEALLEEVRALAAGGHAPPGVRNRKPEKVDLVPSEGGRP